MLFDVTANPGADGADLLTQVVSLTLTGGVGGPGVATTLHNTALDGVPSDTIYLFQVSDTQVVGVVGNDPSGDIALRITLLNPNNPATAQLVVEQYLPIDHGQDGNNFEYVAAADVCRGRRQPWPHTYGHDRRPGRRSGDVVGNHRACRQLGSVHQH